ncbi:MAG: GNAT family N-acetyltransferase [Hyphomicrobiaceae bacterium]|nr:GNAT family N-acetyltransferase [Hyphomicrobiaceae bacterium]
MAGTPYGNHAYALGEDREGRQLRLVAVPQAAARELGEEFARIDPWKEYGIPAKILSSFLAKERDGRYRLLITANETTAGIVVVTVPWLFGPYLHFLGLLPQFQNSGIGSSVMTWFEAEAGGQFRNLWICVSEFNDRAVRFYERFGYMRVAKLEGLVIDDRSEFLLRKRV